MEGRDEKFLDIFNKEKLKVKTDNFIFPDEKNYETDEEFVKIFKEINKDVLLKFPISDHMIFQSIEIDKKIQFLKIIEETEKNSIHFDLDVDILKDLKRKYLISYDMERFLKNINENEVIYKKNRELLDEIYKNFEPRIKKLIDEMNETGCPIPIEKHGDIFFDCKLDILYEYDKGYFAKKIENLINEICEKCEKQSAKCVESLEILTKSIQQKKTEEEIYKKGKNEIYKKILDLNIKLKKMKEEEDINERLKEKIKNKKDERKKK